MEAWQRGRTGFPRSVELLVRAGLPTGLVSVTDESPKSAQEAIAAGVGKIVMTGSEASGRSVLRLAAEHLVPATVELSGCDAMFVLSDADLSRSCGGIAIWIAIEREWDLHCTPPRISPSTALPIHSGVNWLAKIRLSSSGAS